MTAYYIKRVLDILRKEGLVGFSKRSKYFTKNIIKIHIIDSYPIVRRTSFIYFTLIRKKIYSDKYEYFKNPFKPIWINPDDLKYISPFSVSKRFGLGQVFSEDLKHKSDPKPLMQSKKAQGLKSRFEQGEKWENTAYLEWKSKRVDGTVDDVVNACEPVDKLYKNIKEHGYKPNFTKNNPMGKVENTSQNKNTGKVWHGLEPLVVIGPNGTIFLSDGSHRAIISKILGVESIPVNILGRHQNWVKIKEEIYETPFSELDDELICYLSHPDIYTGNISIEDYLLSRF